MDWTLFILLTIACMSGFITTSYSSLAERERWPVGALFVVERLSFVIIIGFICQFGSILVSFFVNPWWSAFLVLLLGYTAYSFLTGILKKHSQIVGGGLAILCFILIPIFIFFKGSTNNETAKHFVQSINYANNASKILNNGNAYDTLETKEYALIIDNYKKARNTSRNVDINILNKRLTGLGDHFQKEFIN